MTTRPEAMVDLPSDNIKLVRTALDIIETCRNDAGIRASYCRQLNMVIETGKKDGTRSLINLLYRMIDRLASHLFSPTDIRFSMDFENEYPPDILDRGKIAARQMSRSWERTNTDITFAMGVFEALKYGGAILKQWPSQQGPDRLPVFHSSLVMPWQFGVYRPDTTSLDAQPAMVETIMLTMPEVWRRIWHMPDAQKLFDRIKQHAAPGNGQDVANNFFHQVLSTSPIQTGVQGAQRPVPGGIVQLSTDPNFTSIPPSSSAPLVRLHELWLWGQGDDYETIQIIEPDILVAPALQTVEPADRWRRPQRVAPLHDDPAQPDARQHLGPFRDRGPDGAAGFSFLHGDGHPPTVRGSGRQNAGLHRRRYDRRDLRPAARCRLRQSRAGRRCERPHTPVPHRGAAFDPKQDHLNHGDDIRLRQHAVRAW